MKKIKWGVLGAAGIFENALYKAMLEAENAEIYAIASRSLERAKIFQEKFGFQKAYESYQELLDDEAVDAVYIPLSNDTHHEWTIKAAEAGKHILCEKPLCGTLAQAKEMFAAAEKHKVQLMEAFAYLHSPLIRALQEDIRSGIIGDLRYMESSFLITPPGMENFRMYKEYYGGALYDVGCYTSSLTLSLMEGMPQQVKGIASYSPEGIDLLSNAQLDYADGRRASFRCAMLLHGQRQDNFALYGTEGHIVSENFEFNKAGEIRYHIHRKGEKGITRRVNCPNNYTLEVEQFGRMILQGEPALVSREFSLKNMELLEKILIDMGYFED